MSTAQRASLFVAVQFMLFAALAGVLIAFPRSASSILLPAGGLLVAAGLVVLLLAVYQHAASNRALPNITPEPNASAGLVDSGIYHSIRHPIYTGVLSICWGMAVGHGHIAPLLIAAVLTVFFTYKSLFEETLLRSRYPAYAAYMTRTGRFLPKWISLR
jgi:protein-S-isoprenylcysteine O-methyltransferase Ste14